MFELSMIIVSATIFYRIAESERRSSFLWAALSAGCSIISTLIIPLPYFRILGVQVGLFIVMLILNMKRGGGGA